MQNLQAAALAKAIREALRPADRSPWEMGPGTLTGFHVADIHAFCIKVVATGFVRVDETILDR